MHAQTLYRASCPEEARLKATFDDGRVRRASVLVHHLDPFKIAISFDQAQAPQVPLGEAVTIGLETLDDGRQVTVAGEARDRFEGTEQRTYVVAFTRLVERHRVLVPLLKRICAQSARASVRIRPRSAGEIELTVAPPNRATWSRGRVLDLSRSGMGLVVPRQLERELGAWDQLGVRVRLPGQRTAYELTGHIRSRRLLEDQVRYGVQLEPCDRHATFADDPAVLAYIQGRQQELTATGEALRNVG